LKANKTVIGVGLTITANPLVVRLLANAGYDWLFIDIEHTLISPGDLITVVQMARTCGISPIVRIQDTEYHLIANVLDTGADGVMVPRVETREQAERVVSFARFPPLGVRGCGTTATLDYSRVDWREALPWLNEQTLVAVQIESPRAIANLEEILRVPGIDAIFIGPLDLSINLNAPGQIDSPVVREAMAHVVATCVAHGMPVGTVMPTPEALKPWWEQGMRFLSCSADSGLISTAGQQNLLAVRNYAGEI
jgi:2-dehydro-3-deoxyglucarate aldolase/4-hydroxy-2-oxoheptanedioate aldolase